jgi:hypothetical protein
VHWKHIAGEHADGTKLKTRFMVFSILLFRPSLAWTLPHLVFLARNERMKHNMEATKIEQDEEKIDEEARALEIEI